MANSDTPFGLKPVMHFFGGPWNGKFNIYYCPATDTAAIYKGDLVTLAGSADATGKYPDVTRYATSDNAIGVAIGFGSVPQLYNPDNLSLVKRAASTEAYIAVVDDPYVIFEIQENGESLPLTITEVGLNADPSVTAGSAVTGLSGMELDSDANTESTNTFGLRILRLVDRPGNALGAHAKWLVRINEHCHLSTTGI